MVDTGNAPKWIQIYQGTEETPNHTMAAGAIGSLILNGVNTFNPGGGINTVWVCVYLESDDATAVLSVWGRTLKSTSDEAAKWSMLKKMYAEDFTTFGQVNFAGVDKPVEYTGAACAIADSPNTTAVTSFFFECPAMDSMRLVVTGATAATEVFGWILA